MPGSCFGKRVHFCLALLGAIGAPASASRFDVPAQAAASGIPAFAAQSGVQILAPTGDLSGRSTRAVHGEFDMRDALIRLLKGTGLVVRHDDGHTIVLGRATEADKSRPDRPVARATAPSTYALSGQFAHSASLDEILVTAQRRVERLQDVPITASVLTSEMLGGAGITTLRDIQTIVPGFTFAGQAVVPQPAIRGVSTFVNAVGSENPIALYVDGIYFAAPAALSNDMPDADRIEVLKGPQGTLFGRNASGGALQIFTKEPSFKPRADLDLTESVFSGSGSSRIAPHSDASIFVTGPVLHEVVAASLSAGYDWSSGYATDDVTGTEAGGWRRATLRAKLLVRPTSSVRIVAAAYRVRNDNQQGAASTPYMGLTAAGAYPGSIIPDQPWHIAEQDGYPNALFHQYGGSIRAIMETRIGTITVLGGYNVTNGTAFNSASGAAGSRSCLVYLACIDVSQRTSLREISQEIDLASRKTGILNFVAGIFYYRASGQSLAAIQMPVVAGGMPVQDATLGTTAYAAYGEVTLNLVAPLFLTFGLRESRERHDDRAVLPIMLQRSKSFGASTPHLAVRYTIGHDINVYAAMSQGYKGGLTGIANTAGGFQPTAPEKLTEYEAGLKFSGRSIRYNLSLFMYNYKNKQEQTYTGTAIYISNARRVRIAGMDFDVSTSVSHGLSFRGGLSWLPIAKYVDYPNAIGVSLVQRNPIDASDICSFSGCGEFLPGIGTTMTATFDATGKRLPRAPRVTASATLAYEHVLGTAMLESSVDLYRSSGVVHDITGTIRQSPYVVANIRFGIRFPKSGMEVDVFSHNVTNASYIVTGLASASGFWVGYAPPRDVGLSLRYRF